MNISEDATQMEVPQPAGDRLFVAIKPFLAAAPAVPDRVAVAKALGVELTVLRDLKADGVTYSGRNPDAGWDVEYFTHPDGHFNLGVRLRRPADPATAPAGVDAWQAELARSGWLQLPAITHPMQLETYDKGSWRIRLEHDGYKIIRLELLNI